jgi:outer membrane beta-barrel protein
MTIRSSILSLSLTVALAAGLLGLAPTASAQEVQITGPLAGAPAVRRLRIYREGRFEVTPQAAFTLTDEYTRTIAFGASATYHFTDWLGVGAWGFFAPIHIDTALTDQISQIGQTATSNRLSLPSAAGFPDQIGTINWGAALQAVFIPLRGKLSLFQKLFIDADFYITGGVAFIGVEERADTVDGAGVRDTSCDGPPPAAGALDECVNRQGERGSRVAITGTFSAGLRLHVNEWMALNLEWRALPFSWNTGGTDEDGATNLNGDGGFADGIIDSADRAFHFNHMFIVGWSFYLPTKATISE